MKKFDLIHMALIIIAILTGYSALQYSLSAIFAFVFVAANGYQTHNPLEAVSGYLVDAVGYAVVTIVLIKNSRKYTAFILKSEPENDAEETLNWDLNRHNMLFVLFIGIGLYTMIQPTPLALYNIYKLFTGKIAAANADAPVNGKNIAIQLLQVTIGALLIYAAPNLTNFIENNIAARGGSSTQPDSKDV